MMHAALLAADGQSFALSYRPPQRGHPPVGLRQGGDKKQTENNNAADATGDAPYGLSHRSEQSSDRLLALLLFF